MKFPADESSQVTWHATNEVNVYDIVSLILDGDHKTSKWVALGVGACECVLMLKIVIHSLRPFI